MSELLASWEAHIIEIGIFIVFLVTFGDYVFKKIWPTLGPLFRRRHLRPDE